MTCLAMLQHFYVHVINTRQLMKRQAIEFIRIRWLTTCIFEISKQRQQSLQLKQVFAMKSATVDIPFELQYLEQISEFSEACHLATSWYLRQADINCVPNSSWVCCDEVFKATWSGELSDKCAAVIYVWNKKLHINVKLNQIKILIILQYIQCRS